MVEVTFQFKDKYTRGDWRTQSCVCDSVEECKEMYGLGYDCEYRILNVEEVEKEQKKKKRLLAWEFFSS